MRSRLLQFVTGTSRVPMNGFKVGIFPLNPSLCYCEIPNNRTQGQRDPLKSMRLYNVKVISTDIFGTKRATGDPRVSKRPYFLGLFGFPKKIEFLNCGFQDFWISSFFWISFHIFGTKRATGDPLVSKRPKFLGLYRFTKKNYFLDFWISGFLDFFIFLDFWPYLRK